MSISRVCEPSDEGPACPFLRRVRSAGESYEAIALANTIFWVYTHFDLGKHKTFVCTATRESNGKIVDNHDCQCCQRGDPTRQRGYLHVWAVKARREEFLEITPDTWKYCRLGWPVVPGLRGWRLVATRGKGATAKITVQLSEPFGAVDMSRMPGEKTPEECLANAMK